MVIAGVVIQTRPGAAAQVALRLQHIPGLALHGGDGRSRLAAVWTGADGETLERLGEELLEASDGVVGFFPTFVAEDPGE